MACCLLQAPPPARLLASFLGAACLYALGPVAPTEQTNSPTRSAFSCRARRPDRVSAASSFFQVEEGGNKSGLEQRDVERLQPVAPLADCQKTS